MTIAKARKTRKTPSSKRTDSPLQNYPQAPSPAPLQKYSPTAGRTTSWANDAIISMIFGEMGLKKTKKLTSSECLGYTRLEQNDRLFQKFKGRNLILWGAGDEILTPAQIPFLEKHLRIPKENIHIYQNNSHFLPEEIPQEVVERVTEFLTNDWK